MSRTYDTGLTSPQRTLIENKIITLLGPLTVPTLGLGGTAKGFLEAVIPISYRVDKGDLSSVDLLLEDVRGRSPAVTIATLDLKSDQAGGPGRSLGHLEVQLNFVTSHKRDLTEGRAMGDAISAADDTADPGIHAMLELVWAYLFDAPMGIATVHELKLMHEHEVVTGEGVTIWQQDWLILVGRDADMARGITQKFTLAVTTLNPTDDQPPQKNIVENTTIG